MAGPPRLDYEVFVGAIERIARLWGRRPFFPDGWEGSSWKEDMLSTGVTQVIWDATERTYRSRVLQLLGRYAQHARTHDPDIDDGAFVSTIPLVTIPRS